MRYGSAESYMVFVRDWWRKAEPGESGSETITPVGVIVRRVPYPGAPKTIIGRHMTLDEARAYCKEWNDTHEAGWRSRKAEFESE